MPASNSSVLKANGIKTGLSLSRRSHTLVQSEIRAMSIECEKARGINLAQGVCDTPVPMPLQGAVTRAMRDGINSYTRYDGLTSLRRAIAVKLRRENGIVADPETEITVSVGSTGAFYAACLALLNPGDEVILFEPYYGYHINTLWSVDAVPTFVTLEPPNWSFSAQALERSITSKTRAIMVNTPANPSGKVFTREELEIIARVAKKHDLFIFTDEIYEYFLYDNRKHISPGSLPGLKERTITISGFSKIYSITGWRIGYSVADRKWAQTIGYMNDLIYVCAPAPLQEGVAAGLKQLKRPFYANLAKQYLKKRERICTALSQAGLKPFVPQGAYYVLADASKLPGKSGKDRALYLLHHTGVASVPGEAFYHAGGRQYLRFCFAKTDAVLKRACKGLKRL